MAQWWEHSPPTNVARFDSRTRHHMWVEFVVGSLLCSERFFSGYSGFPLSSKTNISKFQFDLECTDTFEQVLIHSTTMLVLRTNIHTHELGHAIYWSSHRKACKHSLITLGHASQTPQVRLMCRATLLVPALPYICDKWCNVHHRLFPYERQQPLICKQLG